MQKNKLSKKKKKKILYDSAIHRNARVADVMDGNGWNWAVTVSADLLALENSCADYPFDINREDVIIVIS